MNSLPQINNDGTRFFSFYKEFPTLVIIDQNPSS